MTTSKMTSLPLPNPIAPIWHLDRLAKKKSARYSRCVDLCEPGFAVDDRIKQAAAAAIEGDRSHYAESQGERALGWQQSIILIKLYHLNYAGEENVKSRWCQEAITKRRMKNAT